VQYNGSKMLPGHYVGNGMIDLTTQEFRTMYLILKAEEMKGTPVASSGDEITATIPRTIIGLDKVEDYFKRQAAKTKAALEYDDKLKKQKRMKELEDRVTVLEDYIQGLRDVGRGTEPETMIHWQEQYEKFEDDETGVEPQTTQSQPEELSESDEVKS
jgi:hypothetical protein